MTSSGSEGARDASPPGGGRRQELRTLLHMAFPMIVTQYCFALFQFFDAWMVGALGDEALAAVVPAGLLVFIPATFGIGFLAAVTTFVGHSMGRGKVRVCRGYAILGVLFGGGFGVVVALALWPAAVPLFALFDHDIGVFEYEVAYFRISLIAIAPQLVSVAITNYFIGIHEPRVAMISAACATVLNICCNYVLIFGKAGFPALGLSGAAWGTVIASVVQAAGLFIYFGEPRVWHRMEAPATVPGWSRFKKMARVGFPSGAQDVLEMVAWGVILVWLLGFFGTVHLAAGAILIRCMSLSFLPVEGLGAALNAIVAKSIGEGDAAGALRQAKTGLRLEIGFMFLMGLFFFVFRRPIAGLFSGNELVIEVAAAGFVWVALLQVFDGIHIINVHCLQAVGDTVWTSIAGLTCTILVLLGGGLLVVRFFPEWQSQGIWGVAALFIAVQGVVFALRWRLGAWRRVDLFR
jgi:MATE family multidrug resistance protein